MEIILLILILIFIFYKLNNDNNHSNLKNLTKTIEIVVSRYNESLEWMNEHPFNKFTYIIYNKGVNNNFEKKFASKIIKLSNEGRESHTYLYHIYNNYDILKDITVFFPGSINLKYKKYKAKRLLNSIIKLNNAVFLYEFKINNLQNKIYNFEINNYNSSEKKNLLINCNDTLILSNIRPYGKWYKYNFNDTNMKYLNLVGIFSISKYDIIKNSKDYYYHHIKNLEGLNNPEVGHYYERSWAALFHPLENTHTRFINSIHSIYTLIDILIYKLKY